MNLQTFIPHFASVFDDPPAEIVATTEFRSLTAWNSLAAIGLLAMVNAEYGVILGGDELRACQTVQDVFNTVAAKRHAV